MMPHKTTLGTLLLLASATLGSYAPLARSQEGQTPTDAIFGTYPISSSAHTLTHEQEQRIEKLLGLPAPNRLTITHQIDGSSAARATYTEVMAVFDKPLDLSYAIAAISSSLGGPSLKLAGFAAWNGKERIGGMEATRVTLSQAMGDDGRHYVEYGIQRQLP